LLYVGTDDGNTQRSMDAGESWENLTGSFPGLPAGTWVAGLEPSRFAEGTVYAVFDGHRNDDFTNYIYKSTDYGDSWTSLVGNLPADRVVRAIKEDLRNPNLLYIATEFGFFVSIDGGEHWVELKNNMPTLPFNDMVIHPRDNDLVLGSHGRGIWILDSLSALQELTPEVLASPAHLFSTKPAEQIRYARMTGAPGHNIYYGENPPAGAIIDYWLAEAGGEIDVSVHDQTGAEVARVEATTDRGINRVVWDLRHASFAAPKGPRGEGGGGGFGRGGRGQGPNGPFVVPGTYVVRLSVAGRSYEKPLVVSEDPRINVGLEERRAWTHTLLRIGGMYEDANDLVGVLADHAASLGDDAADDVVSEGQELYRLAGELRRRIQSLYFSVGGWTGGPTADQVAQMSFFAGLIEELTPRVEVLTGSAIQ
jgi:hypothetical protein